MSSANRALIRTQQAEQNVNGIPTQVVRTEFSNYVLVVVTQYGKVGTLISVTPEARSGDATMLSSPAFSTRVLLGKDEALTHVCAKHLAAAAAAAVSQGNRPVLLALSLRDSSLDSVRKMRDLIRGMVVMSTSSSEERQAIGEDMGADVGAGADIGANMGADIGADMYMGADIGADMGADMGADIRADMGADSGADMYMGADIGADMYMGADIGADMYMGADIGADMYMGADSRADMYMGADIGADMGADIGADMYMGADIGADMYMGADIGADMYMGADSGAAMYMGADIGEDLAVEDCPPLGATPAAAPLLLREPPLGLFT